MIEPVVVDIRPLFWLTADNDCGFRIPKRIVMNFEPGAGDIGTVLSVAASVHIKTVAQRLLSFYIVPCFVATPRSTASRNRMAVVVKQVVLDQRKRLVVVDTVA